MLWCRHWSFLLKWCYLCRWLMSFSRLMWQCMWYPLGSLSSRRMETECRLCNRVKPHRLLCQFHPRIPHLGHIENNFRHRLWCMNKKFRAIVKTMHCHKQMHFTPQRKKSLPAYFLPSRSKTVKSWFFLCSMTWATISEMYGLDSVPKGLNQNALNITIPDSLHVQSI